MPIFRGFEQICRVIPLQKNVPYCRKSVGKILQTLTVDTSFFTGCDTGCKHRKQVIHDYLKIGDFTLFQGDAKKYFRAKSEKRGFHNWRDIRVNVYV